MQFHCLILTYRVRELFSGCWTVWYQLNERVSVQFRVSSSWALPEKKITNTQKDPGIFSRLALVCRFEMNPYVQYEGIQRTPRAGDWREPRMKEWQRVLKSIYHAPRWSFFFLPHPGSQNRLCQWKKKSGHNLWSLPPVLKCILALKLLA